MGGDVMREMKDSGLEWVGEVGIDCSFVPLKYFLTSYVFIEVKKYYIENKAISIYFS